LAGARVQNEAGHGTQRYFRMNGFAWRCGTCEP
jgi:hypothetical protein